MCTSDLKLFSDEHDRAEDYKPSIVACYIKDGIASAYIIYLDDDEQCENTSVSV